MMKEKAATLLLEAGLTLAGFALSFVGTLIRKIRQIKHLNAFHFTMFISGFFIFVIGFGLISLLGSEPFAVPVIIIGLIGLMISLAKCLFTLGQIGLILVFETVIRKK
jgi:hypothetical protein